MPRKQVRGFTLIELLVVVSIIVLLIAILLPSLSRARAVAKTTACAANMRQIYVGMTMYAGDYNGMIPPASFQEYNPITGLWPYKTWADPLFVYLPGTTSAKKNAATPMVFICPAELTDPKARASYGINGRLGSDRGYTPSTIGVLKPDGVTIDGTNGWFRLSAVSKPMDLYLFADAGTDGAGSQLYYMDPTLADVSALRHPGPKGLNISYADGHIELKLQLDAQVYYHLPWFDR